MGVRRFTTIARARWVDAILEALTAMVLSAGIGGVLIGVVGRYPFASELLVVAFAAGLFFLAWSIVHRVRERLKRPGTFRGVAVVGEDGLRLDSRKTRHFFAFEEMREIRVDHQKLAVEIALQDGETVDFRVTDPDEVVAALEEGRARAGDRKASRRVRAFERGEAEVIDWAKRAFEMREEVGLREQAITDERLAELAEDHGAEPEQRIAAAMALRDAPEPLRVRVRVAAEATARPYVAEAMAGAVDGEVEVPLLERALRSLPR